MARSASPYLLQHAANPVDWYPWGPEALAAAKQENKPILLSVGYAACHWCHVMAHESFEDPAIAALMNEHFVNVKVDREERPDLDAVYQQALALLGQQGGWPLTLFLTPEGEPFWGGTYFPPEPRYGRAGFPEVLRGVAKVYREEGEKVAKNVTALQEGLRNLNRSQPGGEIDASQLLVAASRLLGAVDPRNGGFGNAPKFPQCSLLALLWLAWRETGEETYDRALRFSLQQMSQGGLYDHLGGGYARYTVDAEWLVPHFEKMLYDNAQILQLLAWAEAARPEALFRQRAEETVGWLLREMLAEDGESRPCGAFASSLDADSEGEEGRFYVWQSGEIDQALEEDAMLFREAYRIRDEGNWEGKTILNRLGETALRSPAEEALLARGRERLFTLREERVRPERDDKVLTDWNALMITALAEAAGVFRQPRWLEAAIRAFAFIEREMIDEKGRLLHSWRRGQPGTPGTLEDHAALAQAALSLYEATGEPRYIASAERLASEAKTVFADLDGSYFQTASTSQDLPVRPKSAQDGPVPSGNALLAGVLLRLAAVTGKTDYATDADAILAAFAGAMLQNSFVFAGLLRQVALRETLCEITIFGAEGDPRREALIAAARAHRQPDHQLRFFRSPAELPGAHPAKGLDSAPASAFAVLCRQQSCSQPINDPDQLAAAILLPRNASRKAGRKG